VLLQVVVPEGDLLLIETSARPPIGMVAPVLGPPSPARAVMVSERSTIALRRYRWMHTHTYLYAVCGAASLDAY
jgi:hypothetical protein